MGSDKFDSIFYYIYIYNLIAQRCPILRRGQIFFEHFRNMKQDDFTNNYNYYTISLLRFTFLLAAQNNNGLLN